MTMNPSNDMQEATRLTSAGRLGEATALLRRMLGGTQAPAASLSANPAPKAAGRRPPVIDHDPAAGPGLDPAQPSNQRRWLGLLRFAVSLLLVLFALG